MTTRKTTVIGTPLTSCGSVSCHCSRRANCTLWGAIGPVSMIAKRWMLSFSCSALAASGMGCTRRVLDESLPARADSNGQESAQLSGVFAFGLCLHHVSTIWPIGIGSSWAPLKLTIVALPLVRSSAVEKEILP